MPPQRGFGPHAYTRSVEAGNLLQPLEDLRNGESFLGGKPQSGLSPFALSSTFAYGQRQRQAGQERGETRRPAGRSQGHRDTKGRGANTATCLNQRSPS
jgi:hypothetical protein